MNSKGKLIVISGFSGSGKGTIVNYLIENDENYSISISATTRAIRGNEIDGVHYFFKTKEEFEKMIANGDLLEHAEYAGNYYGTPKPYVLNKLNEGKNVILEIEQQGGFQVKSMYKDAILIFITTDNFKTLYDRIYGRKTETEETIKKRFTMALREASNAEKYDYILVNDTIENVSNKIFGICNGTYEYTKEERDNNIKNIKNINEDLRRYLNV